MLQLTRKNLWMVPTSGGLWMFAFWFFLLAGAVNYQNNLGFLMVFLIAAMGLVSIGISFRNLQGQSLTLAPDTRLFAQTPGRVRILVQGPRNSQKLTLALNGVALEQMDSQVELPFLSATRGRHPLPPVEVGSLFPFGWLHVRTRWKAPGDVWIYPRPIAGPTPQPVPAARDGRSHSSAQDIQDPDLRPYRPGDSLKRVQWKLARPERDWTVLHRQTQQDSQELDWRGYPGAPLETALSYLTQRVLDCEAADQSFLLRLPDADIPTGQGPAHAQACLQALAAQGHQP
ncbi:MAG: hypothetical protein ACPGU3_07820 [Litorivicinus sp.]